MEVINENIPLGGRIERLVAVIIDGIIQIILLSIILVATGKLTDLFSGDVDSMFTVDWELAIYSLLSFLVIQTYFLIKRGQTLGKMVLNLRIVDEQGNIPSPLHVLGIRYVAVQIIAQVPIVGTLFSLVDALFIFRIDRRCIHDLMAGTYVINVEQEQAWRESIADGVVAPG